MSKLVLLTVTLMVCFTVIQAEGQCAKKPPVNNFISDKNCVGTMTITTPEGNCKKCTCKCRNAKNKSTSGYYCQPEEPCQKAPTAVTSDPVPIQLESTPPTSDLTTQTTKPADAP